MAQQMNDRVTGIAAQVGLEYHLDKAQQVNTVRAHELLHFAKAEGRQLDLVERLFRAYFVEGQNVGSIATLAALQLAIVGGYYTDKDVRERIGYPGQVALELRSWEVPAYLDEGLIDAVVARGPTWRDPATGQRAVAGEAARPYAERWSADPGSTEGGT